MSEFCSDCCKDMKLISIYYVFGEKYEGIYVCEDCNNIRKVVFKEKSK